MVREGHGFIRHRLSCRALLPAAAACPIPLWSSLRAHECPPSSGRAIDRSSRTLVFKVQQKCQEQTRKGWVNKTKPVERGEEATLWLLNKVLDATLQTEPLKFACDQFVARHHWLHLLPPFGPDQRTSASFRRLEPSNGRKMLILRVCVRQPHAMM